jgi:hypothetical protein
LQQCAATSDGGTFEPDLNLTDGQPHQVALDAVDFDSGSRIERIDAATHAVLDTRTPTAFGTGHYVVWTIRGHVIFRVTRTAGVNAVLSGIFID